jgi:hypothetical protein
MMAMFWAGNFLIHGTLAAFTSELPLCTTMPGKLLPRDYFGHQLREVVGALIGRAQIAARDTL